MADRRDQTDAVVPVTVGTVAWGIALVVTFLLRDRLAASLRGELNAAFELGFELAKGALSFTLLTLKQAKRFPNHLAGGLVSPRFHSALKERVELGRE
jgi:hypothetical protein